MTTDNTNTTRNDSLAARTDTWLQSFLVWSPGQRDIIKTVALVLMVLDCFFPVLVLRCRLSLV